MNTFLFGTPNWEKWDPYNQKFYTETFIDAEIFSKIKSRLPLDLGTKFNFNESGKSLHLKSKLQSEYFLDLAKDLNSFSTMLLNQNTRFIPLTIECEVTGANNYRKIETILFAEAEALYLLTFYMSGLVRYRPHVWEGLISGREHKLVTLVRKFLYYGDTKFIGLVASHVNSL